MRARILFASVFAVLCLPLFLLPSDGETLDNLGVAKLLADDSSGLLGRLTAGRTGDEPDSLDPGRDVSRIELVWTGKADMSKRVESIQTAWKLAPEEIERTGEVYAFDAPGLEGGGVLRLAVRVAGDRVELIRPTGDGTAELSTARGSRWSLVPPIIAILLAFLTRSTIPSLFLGALAGSFLIAAGAGNALGGLWVMFVDIIWGRILNDSFHVYILGFVLLLSGTVAVVTRMGGIEGMVQALVRFAKSSRSVQAVAYFLGIGIFFDDYANTIVVGNSAGPLVDKMRVSRAKLAYIVDSTAAPVAGVAILSTWVAYQISTYAPQLPTIGRSPSDGYPIFLETIPFRFYCLFALILVGLSIFMKRDIGPMVDVERKARGGEYGPTDKSGKMSLKIAMAEGLPARWINGVLPLFTMIAATFALIVYYGADALAVAAEQDASLQTIIDGGGMVWMREVLARSDSTASIFYGSLAALVVAALLALGQRLLKPADIAATTCRGIGVLFKDAVLILLLAWAIGRVCGDLATANYLVSVFQDLMAPALLPIVLFITACFVAFSTGSSWSTMAILQPNVVLLADRLGEQSAMGSEALLVLSIGAVLEGAIFGDHCSPISDTTILSSTASRCNHIDHVRTQAPYALLAAGVALLIGYLPVAFLGVSPWISMAVGLVALITVLRLIGRNPEDPVAA